MSSEVPFSGQLARNLTRSLISFSPNFLPKLIFCSLFRFYVIESGILRANYVFPDHSHSVNESMVAGTVAGELSFLSRTKRNTNVVAERDSVLWKMEVSSHEELGKKEGWQFARKFEEVLLKIANAESEGEYFRNLSFCCNSLISSLFSLCSSLDGEFVVLVRLIEKPPLTFCISLFRRAISCHLSRFVSPLVVSFVLLFHLSRSYMCSSVAISKSFACSLQNHEPFPTRSKNRRK
jgi:hypothetical protein